MKEKWIGQPTASMSHYFDLWADHRLSNEFPFQLGPIVTARKLARDVVRPYVDPWETRINFSHFRSYALTMRRIPLSDLQKWGLEFAAKDDPFSAVSFFLAAVQNRCLGDDFSSVEASMYMVKNLLKENPLGVMKSAIRDTDSMLPLLTG